MAATEHIRDRSRDRHRERSKERTKKRERSRSRDRDSKRSRRSPVPENSKDSRRGHRSRSRERERSKRDSSPDRSKPLDFAARQAARGDRDDKGTGKTDRDAARSSKHSRSDSRDVKPSRPSRERDTGDRHRREGDRDRPHENGRARSRDRHTDNKPDQSDLPGPPAENGAASATVKKAEPLSLEELLRKKQEEQAELAKVNERACVLAPRSYIATASSLVSTLLTFCYALQPKFLSKKEREELALKRRQEEVELQKAK